MFGFLFVPLVFTVTIVSLIAFFDAEFYTTYIQPVAHWFDKQLATSPIKNNKTIQRSNSQTTVQQRKLRRSTSSSSNTSRTTSPTTLRRRALRRMHRQAALEQQYAQNVTHTPSHDVWSEFTPNTTPITKRSHSTVTSTKHKHIAGIQLNDTVKTEYIERTKHNRALTYTARSVSHSPSTEWKQYSAPVYTQQSVTQSPSIPLHPISTLPNTRHMSTPIFVVNQPINYTAPSIQTQYATQNTQIHTTPMNTHTVPMSSVSPNPYYAPTQPNQHQYTSPVPISYSQSIPTYTNQYTPQSQYIDNQQRVLQYSQSTPIQQSTTQPIYDDKSIFAQHPTATYDQSQIG